MQFVSITVDGGIATVQLERPDKRNAVHLPMFEELAEAGHVLAARDDLRVVVLAGAGEAFCAGLDLGLFAGAAPDTLGPMLAPRLPSPANLFQAAAWVWREMPVPVICAMHGVAFGAGLQIALGADLRVAAPDTRISVMEVRWGLVPDMGLSVTSRGRVRLDRLCELAWTGRIIDGTEARELGLVTSLAADPLAEARRLAGSIAGHSPSAVRAIKTLLRDGRQLPPAEALALEGRIQSGLIGTAEQREAAEANVDGRPPVFDR